MKGEEFYDYYEPVIVFCRFPGCDWEEQVATWSSDLDMKEAFTEHFEEVHS
jgi:hypothetical protein